jgi:hypothetical protein
MMYDSGRDPPGTECQYREAAMDSDINHDRCGSACTSVYHNGPGVIRSAIPFDESTLSCYEACRECGLPRMHFTHPRCGETDA